MIEFYGVLSDECKIESAKIRSKRAEILPWVATFILGIIPTIVLGILRHSQFYVFLGLTILISIVNLLNLIPVSKSRMQKFKIPSRVIIDNNQISTTALGGQNPMKSKPLTKVKKVIDAGDWYYIIFKYGDITNSWVCQKDLIIQGSIEEFENIFQDKIVRHT